jgi:hypothetical protein
VHVDNLLTKKVRDLYLGDARDLVCALYNCAVQFKAFA